MKQPEIDPGGDEPPFEQVRRQVAAMVTSGELAPGEKLPTVRRLATDLGLAVNTVARAYRELEADGVVLTQGRRGTFVASPTLSGDRPADVGEAAARLAVTARSRGLSLAEATRMLELAWANRAG